MENKVTVVKVDPYGKFGVLVPYLAQRISDAAEATGDEAGITTPMFMTQLWGKSQNVLLLAAVNSKAEIKGFAAATLDQLGQVVFMPPRLDEPTSNDAVKEMMDMIEAWAREIGASTLRMITRRADPKWLKKYGYETTQYIMTKELSVE